MLKEKRPILRRLAAVAVNIVAPGAGHALLGRWWRGLCLGGAVFALWFLVPWTGAPGVFALAAVALWLIAEPVYLRIGNEPIGRRLATWCALLAALAGLRLGVARFYLGSFKMGSTESMTPALQPGDHLFASLLPFSPGRGDLVLIYTDSDAAIMTRVVGIAGDRVALRAGRLVVNDTVTEPPGDVPANDLLELDEPIDVPADHVFLLHDRRDIAAPGLWGPVPVDKVRGKALFIWWANDRARVGRTL